MWVRERDGQMSDVGESKEYLFLPPALTLWSSETHIPLCFTICASRDTQVTLNLKGSILIGSWVHITWDPNRFCIMTNTLIPNTGPS